MTDVEIDLIILRHWPIEDAMAGKKPTFETLRATAREVANTILEELAAEYDEDDAGVAVSSAETAGTIRSRKMT